MIGKTITHYKILEKLGEGGMGVVYLAEDFKLKRKIALKFLPTHIKNEADKIRFLQEAQAAAALNHPNVCTVYEIQDQAEKPFIAMEYVGGQTLKEKILEDKLTSDQVIDYALQIADALKDAHDKGIVHRDIKSDNIMVTTRNQIKVMDFGLAKLKGSVKITKDISTVGTLAYMAPEQIEGKKVDARSDIFSFGIVLYEMLTGQLPFKGDYEAAVMYSILNEEPEPIQKYSPEITSELLHVLYRALEKNPEERYQSINDMLIELRRLKRDSSFAMNKSSAEILSITSSKKTSFSKSLKWIFMGILVLAVILFIFYKFSEVENGKKPFEQMQITRLTSHGKAKDASISPDGNYIIHVMEEAGKESLWLRQVATNSNVQILTPDEVRFQGLTFSSDGNYIYYTSMKINEAVPNLYRMPALGGGSTKLLENVSGSISFSPDNTEFAFIRFNFTLGKTELMIADVNGLNERTLSEQIFPEGMFTTDLAWSPEGNYIICGEFKKAIGACTLIMIDINDGTETMIGSQKWRWIENIVWSTSKNFLIINASVQSSGSQIWGVSYPDGEVRRITNDLNDYDGLSSTGDGTSLVTVQSERQANIWIIPQLGSGDARQITTGKYDGSLGIVWTPDGRIVHGSQDMKLWLISNDDSHSQRLSSDEDNDCFPSISRDGQTVVFTSQPVSILEVWKMNIDGSHRTKLADYAGDPQISPDGKWVIFTSAQEGSFTLWRISIIGGDSVKVFDTPAMGAAISPDGKKIACFIGDKVETEKLMIGVFPFEGGEPEFKVDLPQNLSPNSLLRWTPDGLSLTYIIDTAGVSNIWSMPLDGGSPIQLTHFKEHLIFAFEWSRDGTLACSRGEIKNDVVLIRNIK